MDYKTPTEQNAISSRNVPAIMSYIHDNFLPGGVVGDEGDGLLLVCHRLCGVDYVLEHGSLPAQSQTGEVAVRNTDNHPSAGRQCEDGISRDLLEVKGQIGGDDADIKQVLHMLKLALLEVAEDVQRLQEGVRNGKSELFLPFNLYLFFLFVFWLCPPGHPPHPVMCLTSSAISVLLYSKWCLSMMEEP